ncbi:MAG: CIA30 family protein [Caldilineaceae bacterium]
MLTLTAFVQPLTPASALERFFTSDQLQADWFTDDFLAQVPLPQIEDLRQQISEQLGAFQHIEGTASPFTVIFAQGRATAAITLDASGKIAGLRITQPQPATTTNPPAPTITPKAALERLFTSATLESDWFSNAFLAQVSPTQIETILAQWTKQFGDFVQVAGANSPFTVRLAHATISAEIALDSEGRIAGLFFHPPIPTIATLDAAITQFAALPGAVGVLVTRAGEPLATLNADEPLAVGSAFKLAVLNALRDQIAADEHTWDEVVQLDPAWKSLPSGILQTWPDNSPLTLHTLATLMISISDNTAADSLLHVVDRNAVEDYTTRNRPFLATQEAFKLKTAANADLLARYQGGDEAVKRQVLTDLAARSLPTPAEITSTPTLTVEWFFTAKELCDLMAQVQGLDMMSVSPGPAIANPAAWAHVAYKGGSEVGVINLTYWLESPDGATYCVTATQNRSDAAVDEARFAGLTGALISTLASSMTITSSTTLTGTQAITPTTTLTATTTPAATPTATGMPTATVPLTATLAPTATDVMTGTGAAAQNSPLVFTNVRLFDGETVIPSTTVVVEDGLITAVGPDVERPPAAQVIDGAGKTLLPGLIDAHTHVFSPDALRQALIFGVTTELDMFMDEALAAQLRAEQAATGAVDRADLFSAGTLATAPGGHGTQFGLIIPTLTGPDQAEAFVADRVAAGADYIKIIIENGHEIGLDLPTLDAATVAALVGAAHAHDKLALVHVQTYAAAQEALDAGVDGLAHIFTDAVPDEDFIQQAVDSNLFVIPTLAVFQNIGSEPADRSVIDDPLLSPYLTDADIQSLENPYSGFADLSLANGQQAVNLLFDAGVPILAGTDAPNPGTAHGASLHRELVLLTDAGLSPLEALRAATSVTADTFSLTDRGRIAPGLRADLLLVNGDPTTEITATRDIAGVWKLGVPVDRAGYLANLAAQRSTAESQRSAFNEGDTALVSSFDAGELTANFGSGWQSSTDELAGGASTAELTVADAGANGSNGALAINGEVTAAVPFAWAGAIFMPGATAFAPFDLSSKPVLHFWAKGDDRDYRVQLFCANLGQTPVNQPFTVTNEWQEFTFNLADMGGCDTTGVQGIVFSTGPTPGTFALQLDEVSLQQP